MEWIIKCWNDVEDVYVLYEILSIDDESIYIDDNFAYVYADDNSIYVYDNNDPVYLHADEINDFVKRNDVYFGRPLAKVILVDGATIEYIRTKPDGTLDNNLSNLSSCSD